MNILGISAFYHDSAAALIKDGIVIAAAQEERFTRKKHDERFPKQAITYCLQEANITINDVDYVVFYEKTFLKFERLLETYLAFAPQGLQSFVIAIPAWIKEKFWIPQVIKKELGYQGKLLFTQHHQSHAASAFFASPFQTAAVLTMDAVGEWTTTSFGFGKNNELQLTHEINFPHSLGMLYSAFTYYTGFKVNSGEYKVMGLAPYGEPKYADLIRRHLIDIKDDGSFRLNMKYFNYAAGLTMTNKKFHDLFGGPPRKSESELTQKEMDLARSIQDITEEIVLKTGKHIYETTGQKNLCMAGGVALNCVANGRLLREGPFDDIWIQPAAGDAGGALGAALYVWYQYLNNQRKIEGDHDLQNGSYYGPAFTDTEIKAYLEQHNIPYTHIKDSELFTHTANLIAQGNVIGWFQGRMEFGPRALGNRSIIGDARNPEMQSKMNLKIKYRESFRPFAPSVLAGKVGMYFEFDKASPYMLFTAYINKERRKTMSKEEQSYFGIAKLNVLRSDVPAITHVDYSARLQTVHKETNPRYHALLTAFYEKTNCPVIVNTSFNVRGEPIVCTPEDAYNCFMRTEMDYLVMGNYILDKTTQPELKEQEDWKQKYELD